MIDAYRFRIRGLTVLSAVGSDSNDWCDALKRNRPPIETPDDLGGKPVFSLSPDACTLVGKVQSDPQYKKLDRASVLAIASANRTIAHLDQDQSLGCVSIGSSRGPTQALESTHQSFLQQEGRVPLLTSPVTTAGNLASWVAQSCLFKRGISDPQPLAAISTSMTCSSAFQSMLIAMSFLKADLAQMCLFGGTEACLTPYTIAQLEALRIYTTNEGDWPCRPFASAQCVGNSVTLGEGAGTALLIPATQPVQEGDLDLLGLGWAMEEVPSATGISSDGVAFQRAMQMAASALAGSPVDAVIAHAPGSLKGDQAELRAIRATFGDVPVISTKHLTGHTYGASGMVSLGLAQALLGHAHWPGLPYPNLVEQVEGQPGPRVIAINTAGFGGNAITAIVARAA
jgi:3-oxoacyl-[acyl-carrier-protein] synthase II